MLNQLTKYTVFFARYFVGVLFIFSGIIKANDPMGFGFKLQEYFEVFGMHFLLPYAFILSILFCALEIVLGICLIAGIYPKITVYTLLALIVFFSFLTFFSAYFQVVTSCGCFGDAIPLTPWESFIKDIFLMLLILILIFHYQSIIPLSLHPYFHISVLVFSVVIGLGLGIYTYNFLPIKNFLPYKIGADINQLKYIPENAPSDEYKISFLLKNKKTEEQIKVSMKDYMDKKIYQDTTLEFIAQQKKLIKKGFRPAIEDFLISTLEGNDVTHSILNNPQDVLLITMHDINESYLSDFALILEKIDAKVAQSNMLVFLLTASSLKQINALKEKYNFSYPIYTCDGVPLKSMVRSNPGFVLLRQGKIIDKWHHNNF